MLTLAVEGATSYGCVCVCVHRINLESGPWSRQAAPLAASAAGAEKTSSGFELVDGSAECKWCVLRIRECRLAGLRLGRALGASGRLRYIIQAGPPLLLLDLD